MVATILALGSPLAAANAAETRTCTAAPGSPVAVRISPLDVTALGGRYISAPGWPPPGKPMIGETWLGWGLMIRFEDARFEDFDRVMPGLHSRRSGCWIGYQVGAWSPGKPSLTNVRITEDPFASIGHPVQPEQPARAPQLAGYRFVEGALAFSPDYKWVGLWVANGRADRSLIVAFDDSHYKVLARLPFRFSALQTLPSPDTPLLGMTLIGEGRAGTSIPFIELGWMSGIPEQSAATPK